MIAAQTLSKNAFAPLQTFFIAPHASLKNLDTASIATFAALLIFSHKSIQNFRNASDLFHNTTNAATNATIAMMISDIGLAFIAALSSHCAAVTSLVCIAHALSAAPTAPIF